MVPPSIFIYDDRLEIVSYGSLPFDLSLDEFFSGTSKPVNRALMVVFQDADLVEQSGHGIPHVVKNYGREAFTLGGDMVKVTIPFGYVPDSVLARKVREQNTAELSQNQAALLKYLSAHPRFYPS
jgi:ATP-dependent DNA helicase RecG